MTRHHLLLGKALSSGEITARVKDKSKKRELLIEIARERGLEEVRADVLTENEKMLKV